MPDIIKLDNSQYYKAHYTCSTFNTHKQNTRKGLTRIHIAPWCKTNFAKDWSSYWFYVKVLTVKIRQPSHEFTFGVGMTFVSYSLVLTPVV
jgi:hypothetical protein